MNIRNYQRRNPFPCRITVAAGQAAHSAMPGGRCLAGSSCWVRTTVQIKTMQRDPFPSAPNKPAHAMKAAQTGWSSQRKGLDATKYVKDRSPEPSMKSIGCRFGGFCRVVPHQPIIPCSLDKTPLGRQHVGLIVGLHGAQEPGGFGEVMLVFGVGADRRRLSIMPLRSAGRHMRASSCNQTSIHTLYLSIQGATTPSDLEHVGRSRVSAMTAVLLWATRSVSLDRKAAPGPCKERTDKQHRALKCEGRQGPDRRDRGTPRFAPVIHPLPVSLVTKRNPCTCYSTETQALTDPRFPRFDRADQFDKILP